MTVEGEQELVHSVDPVTLGQWWAELGASIWAEGRKLPMPGLALRAGHREPREVRPPQRATLERTIAQRLGPARPVAATLLPPPRAPGRACGILAPRRVRAGSNYTRVVPRVLPTKKPHPRASGGWGF